MVFKYPNFLQCLSLLSRGAVLARSQRTQEVQGSIPSKTTGKKIDGGGFQFSFFLNPCGMVYVDIMDWTFLCLGNDILFKSILTHCENEKKEKYAFSKI